MIIDLGIIDFEKAVNIQKELLKMRVSGKISDSLIVAEHDSVFTLGRSKSRDNFSYWSCRLKRMGHKLVIADRGGDITYHGPGQIVAYPIIDLRERGRDMHKYLRDLESAIIDFISKYKIDAYRKQGMTGVWSGNMKVASIGVAASNWITYHGASINICCDLSLFSLISPCGLKNVTMTSLDMLCGCSASIAEAKSHIIGSFCSAFLIDRTAINYA